MNINDIRYYMNIALIESKKAAKKNEIPVGSIVVSKITKKIISKAHNQTEKLSDPTAHAEILAIRKAAKKINDWRLTNHVIFTTLEPCKMCMEMIKEARIQTIYYGAVNTSKQKKIKEPECIKFEIKESALNIKEFFKKIR